MGINNSTAPSAGPSDNSPVSQSILTILKNAKTSAYKPNQQETANILPLKNQPPLVSNNKPEILYIGADYCPYCAAERWVLVTALSKFGTFSKLNYMTSSTSDVDPGTNTFTFYNSVYTSKYISFVGVETSTNISNGSGGYTPLQSITTAQQALFQKFDYPPTVPSQAQGAIPFIDLGNRAIISGAQYLPSDLSNKNWSQIAKDVKNGTSPDGMDILSSANAVISQICSLTQNQPISVCG